MFALLIGKPSASGGLHFFQTFNRYGDFKMPVIQDFTAFMAKGLTVPPEKTKIEYSVADEPGLFVECRAKSSTPPTWYLRLKNAHGTNVYKRLGTVRELTLPQARKLVRQIRIEHQTSMKSQTPATTSTAPMTLERFFQDIYLPQAKIHKRSYGKDESLFRNRIGPRFGHLLLTEITRMTYKAFIRNFPKKAWLRPPATTMSSCCADCCLWPCPLT